MGTPLAEIRILVPRELKERLLQIANRNGITVEDLVLRAIVKVLEEMG